VTSADKQSGVQDLIDELLKTKKMNENVSWCCDLLGLSVKSVTRVINNSFVAAYISYRHYWQWTI
jgi:predicted 3-demethylubiquinone-9 3-methyltransferase (glyoxalase superfamily)